MSQNSSDNSLAECRKRLRRCVLIHLLVMVLLALLFALIGCFLKGFDVKHLLAELLIVYLAISFHLCADRLFHRYGHLNNQLKAARARSRPTDPPQQS